MRISCGALLEELKKIDLPGPSREANDAEKELTRSVLALIRKIEESNNYHVEEDEELLLDPSEEEIDYFIAYEPLQGKNELFTYDYIDRVLKYKDEGHSFKSIQHMFRRVKHDKYLTNFKKYHDQMGTNREKYARISSHCWNMFIAARDSLSTIHDRDIRRWALEEARKLQVSGFTASHSWLQEFKRKNKIVSRKITRFVTMKQQMNKEEIENRGVVFLQKFEQEIGSKFGAHEIFNTDQSGYQYEMHGQRTLSFEGEKDTSALARSSASLSHSYTIQPLINMAGTLMPRLMIVLQEKDGTFGPRVRESLPQLPGVFVTCSRSGKVEKNILREWTRLCLTPCVDTKACLVVDSFSSHKATELFRIPGKEVTVRILPEGSTSFLQPLDVYFFHQWKDFAKRFSERVILDALPVNLHERKTIITLHGLIWNQFRAPIFNNMIRFAWKKSGFSVECEMFDPIERVLFDVADEKCSKNCNVSAFIQCSYCKCPLCLMHFFQPPHDH